ncbi:MAG: DUF4831 family protein [Bacteroidales bacterium]|nr:DUF4831 family protein [Bacteroidales bacterium]
MRRIIALAFCLGVFCAAWAQNAVYPLPLENQTAPKGNYVHYALSQTAFEVNVTITKVREIKGYYTDYAQTLLGLTNVISENRTFYKVNNVEINPVILPDPNHTYLVVLDKNQQKLIANKAAEPTIWMQNELETFSTKSTPIPDFFKNYSDPSYAEMEDSFTETKIIDGVITQVPANRTKLVNVTNSQKAQQAAEAISKSRQDQYNLVKGEQETTYSKEALELMLKELKQWEENYLSLFTGLVLEDEIHYKFYVCPNTLTTDLFSFNQDKGLSYGYDINKNDKVYSVELNPGLTMETVIDTTAKNPKTLGYRYRTPVSMQAAIVTKDPGSIERNTLFDLGNVNMYQFARIQTLPLHQDIDIDKIGFIY